MQNFYSVHKASLLVCFTLIISICQSQTYTETKTSSRIFTNWPERWTGLSPANISADDNKFLSTIKLLGGTSRPIVFTGLNFNIPSSATIDRIGIKIIRLKSGKNNVKDGFCTLVTGPDDLSACGAFPNVANPEYWTTSEKTINYTQPSSGIGSDGKDFQWTPAMINANGFGVFFDINFFSGGSGSIASLEQVQVTVYYTLKQTSITSTQKEDIDITERSSAKLHPLIYPNPAIHSATILFFAVESAETTLEIYNIKGARIKTEKLGAVNKGNTYHHRLDLSNMPAGSYMYKLKNGSFTGSGKLQKTQ